MEPKWPEKTQLAKDISYMIQILPLHYICQASRHPNSVHCFSKKGIRKDVDAEDTEAWELIMEKIKKHFGSRFREVDHNVCFVHQDFTVYLTA